MPNSPSGNSLRRSPRGKLQQRYESSLAKKKKAPGRKNKSVPKRKSAKTKSKVNTAAAKNAKKSGAGKRSRNSESADGKTHERKRTSERTAGSTKGSRTKSVAARQHRDVDEHNSIENSCSSNSSEEEASVHSTDDNSDMVGSTDSVDHEGAAWEEGSDIGECNTGNDKAQSLFSRTSFNDALEREKDNSEEGEPFQSIKTAGRATSQMHNEDATSRTAGERRPPIPTTVMESSTNGNPLRQHGGRLEGLAMDLDEVKAGLRGLTRKESMEKRQPHMAERVRHYVKSFIFRRIKFVNSDQMSQKALHLVMDHENVPTRNRETFYMLYDSVFNEALNTKRSSCEQAAGRIVRDSITKLENPDDFFTFEELCKLRRATTERERNAFFWFFGTFMDSVCGRRTWGKQKYKQLVSTACETGGQSKLVTRSDEAFGLLLFENYIDKWKMTTTVAARASGNNGTGQCESNRKSKLRGKYTGKKSGHCKYGGWCHEGTTRFNELYAMVGEDRVSAQAAEMEKELLRYCHAQEYGNAGNDGDTAHEDGGQTNASSTMLDNVQPPVEACWDEV